MPQESKVRIILPPGPVQVKFPDLFPTESGYDIKMQTEKKRKESEKTLQTQGVSTSNLAVKSQDSKLCESIISDALRIDCIDSATLAKAMDSSDISMCKTLTGTSMTLCVDKVNAHSAYTQKNKKLCNSLSQTGSKLDCIEGVENILWQSATGTALENCDLYSSKNIHDNCLTQKSRRIDISNLNQAISKNDGLICKKIEDQEINTQCTDNILLLKAKEIADEDICASVENPTTREQCKQNIMLSKDMDLYKKALSKKDNSYCGDISSSSLREACLKTALTSSK